MDLYEIKVFREAGNGFTSPSRDEYHYINAWGEMRGNVLHCCVVGGEGWFPSPDSFCPNFLGYYPSVVLGQIERDRYLEADRIMPAN